MDKRKEQTVTGALSSRKENNNKIIQIKVFMKLNGRNKCESFTHELILKILTHRTCFQWNIFSRNMSHGPMALTLLRDSLPFNRDGISMVEAKHCESPLNAFLFQSFRFYYIFLQKKPNQNILIDCYYFFLNFLAYTFR